MTSIPVLAQVRLQLWPLRWRLLLLFVGMLIPLYLFGTLAEEVVEQEGFFFDLPVLQSVHGHATPLYDRIMLFFTALGSRWVMIPLAVLIALVLVARRRWASAVFWGLAVGGGVLLNLAAKHSFARIRPALWPSLAPETTFSFPSGHSVGSMAFVVALSVLTWRTRWRWPVLICGSLFVFLVGLSRIYLGVHYPSDVIAAWAAALAWVVGLAVLLPGMRPRQEPTRAAG